MVGCCFFLCSDCDERSNLSAPHIYGALLRLMRLQPGHRVLDVGSGTGYMSALCALLVGPTGSVHGWELSASAVDFARRVWATADGLAELQAAMAPVAFERRDCFHQVAEHEQGAFDSIVVGSTLERAALPHLLQLLRRPGGTLVAPVDDQLTAVSWDAAAQAWDARGGLAVRFRPMIMARTAEHWTPTLHGTLPHHFRRAVLCLLCVWRHTEHPLAQLPFELVLHIVGRMYEPPLVATAME